MTMKEEQYEDEINLLEYWQILVKRKKLIAVIVGAALALSVVVSLVLPKTYISKASIMPPQQGSSLAAGMVAGLPEGLGGFAGSLLGAGAPSDLWVGILNSMSVRDAIIERFNLRELYDKETIEDTRGVLNKAVSVEKSKEEIISVSVEDKKPERAAEIANAFIEELDRINRELLMTSGKSTRVFVERRLGEAKTELATAEEELKDFMKKNRAVNLDEQSKALVEATGALMGQLMGKEVALQTLLSYSAPSNPQAQILKTEVDQIRAQLSKLQSGGKDMGSEYMIPAAKLPDTALAYARLLRNAKFQQTLFDMLTQQYEMARIQEAKDSPTVQVLDIAKTPEKKSKPRRSSIVLLSTLSAFFFSIVFVFFREYAEK